MTEPTIAPPLAEPGAATIATAQHVPKPLPYMEPEEWRQQYASHIFMSNEAIRWFIRQHAVELIAGGAIIQPARKFMLNPEKFERAVSTIGQRLAAVRAKVQLP